MNGLMCFKAPNAEAGKFYRHVINMGGPGKGFINCVSPRDVEELTLMISFPLYVHGRKPQLGFPASDANQ